MSPSSLMRADSKSSGSDKESPHSVAAYDYARRSARNTPTQSLRSRTGTTRRKKGKQHPSQNRQQRDDMVLPIINGTSRNKTTNGYDSVQEVVKRKIKRTELVPRRIMILANRIVSSPFTSLFVRLVWRFRKILGPILLFLFLDYRYQFRNLYVHYFGIHPIHGGSLGVKLDHKLLQKIIDETHERKKKDLRDSGVVLPEVHRTVPTDLLQINTNAALREYLLRREKRSLKLIEMEDSAENYLRECQERSKTFHPLGLFHGTDHPQRKSFPQILLVPDSPSLNIPRPGKPSGYYHATFAEMEMRDLIEDSFATLLETFDTLENPEARIDLWAVCAIYFYGGLFLSNEALANQEVVETIMESKAAPLFRNSSECSTPTGMLAFTRNPNKTEPKPSNDIFMLAASPRHPHLRCLLNALEGAPIVRTSEMLSSFFLGTWDSSATYQQQQSASGGDLWEVVKTRCGYGQAHSQRCCLNPIMEHFPAFPTEVERDGAQGLFYVYEVQLPKEASNDGADKQHQVQVDISIGDGAGTPVKIIKLPIETDMKEKHVAPGWLCNRCLKTAYYGTFEKCAAVCPKGYIDAICTRSANPELTEVAVDVVITNYGKTKHRMPRIIHQTWFEELSPDRYPQLIRLQNSWKNTGWEYRFYTDQSAREYIVENFPQRFVDAFDAVIPGAYKADLFRYLVLLRDGGIYADVDVILDTNIDLFVTGSLSFFAPRDVVCEYADESFCLWNGIMGAAPGHPFIIRAAERVVNLILNRADMYDLERDVCLRTGPSMENWKVRAEPLLLASGPCALGVAVNDALGRDLLSKFEIGWIPLSNFSFGNDEPRDHGDALIMVGDKYDLGAFRISDPERSFILASTDMPGVLKQPRTISNPTRTEKRRQLLRKPVPRHYSEAAKGEFVWGMHKVYQDDLTNDEVLKFNVVYQ